MSTGSGPDGGPVPGPGGAPARPRPSFGRVFAVVYCVALVALLALPASEETRDFGGRVARQFPVAVVWADASVGVHSLAALGEIPRGERPRSFLLPSAELVIDAGDVHRARVLEDHGDWQLIAFHYANTRTSTYRAWRDRVEPVSHRATSHLGQPVLALVLLLPAALLAAVITLALRRVTR